jgi:hypothetical protein
MDYEISLKMEIAYLRTGELFISESLKNLKSLRKSCELAISQLTDEEIHKIVDNESNSIAVLIQHIAGNMISRWTDFLTTDGEKPNRNRDAEFVDNKRTRKELTELWEKGWKCMFDSLETVKEDDLQKIIKIRGEEHTLLKGIIRASSHYAFHTGQIVYLAKMIKSAEWKTLSVPKKK